MTRPDRTVAIKVLPPHLAADPQFHDRFDREACVVAALNHPHICTLFDVDTQDPSTLRQDSGQVAVHVLVMEYLKGETLADRLTKGALLLDHALRIAVSNITHFTGAGARGIGGGSGAGLR